MALIAPGAIFTQFLAGFRQPIPNPRMLHQHPERFPAPREMSGFGAFPNIDSAACP